MEHCRLRTPSALFDRFYSVSPCTLRLFSPRGRPCITALSKVALDHHAQGLGSGSHCSCSSQGRSRLLRSVGQSVNQSIVRTHGRTDARTA